MRRASWFLQRASNHAVQDFLVMNGIGPERINARGYGEAYPVASNNTAAGRQQVSQHNQHAADRGQQHRNGLQR